MGKEALQIDLVYDIICPWCYIGHHRLQKAIQKTNANVTLKLIPYQLRPNLPLQGIPIKEYWLQKGIDSIDEAYQEVTEAAFNEGLVIAPFKFNTIPNTLKLHQVIHLAEEKGVGIEVLHAIQTAYFREGANLTELSTVLKITETYITEVEVEKAWNDKEYYQKQVLMKEQEIKSKNVTVVPTYIINNKQRISGAVHNHTLIDMLQQLAPIHHDGKSCSFDGNGVC